MVTITEFLLKKQGDGRQSNFVEYTDLGLPSGNLWANYNIGAKNPLEQGKYYMYNEVSPIELSYKKMINFYNNYKEKNYDPVDIITNGLYRIPDKEDIIELTKNCEFIKEPNFLRVVGPNKNSIIFPYIIRHVVNDNNHTIHLNTEPDIWIWLKNNGNNSGYYGNAVSIQGKYCSPSYNKIEDKLCAIISSSVGAALNYRGIYNKK